jgi:alpha-beta hydrolase superfamily lysophospholipase
MMLWLVAAGAVAGQVQVPSMDGVALVGDVWGRGERGVLLIHDEARNRADWGTLGTKLAMSGYHVLAIDLRGHGASPSKDPLGADWSVMVADVEGGVSWLAAHGAKEIHVVGARLGANLALQAAGSNPAISDLVLLSPALNVQGVKISSAIAPYGERPLFLVTSGADALSLRAAQWLEAEAKGPKRLERLDQASSGARMLHEAPELESLIVSWISGSLRAPSEAAAHLSKEGELRTGVSDIQTKGVRIDDR